MRATFWSNEQRLLIPLFYQVDFWLSAEHHLTEHITKLLATFHSDAKAGKRQ